MRGRLTLALLCTAALLMERSVLAQAPDESTVKSRVALAVARFAELPEQATGSALRICVLWGGSVPKPFTDLAQQKVGTRSVVVATELPPPRCDVVYIDASVRGWRERLADLGSGVLTVGDVPGFLGGGGMIELIVESDAVRFDVSLPALRQSGIRLPGQVLKLARRVKE